MEVTVSEALFWVSLGYFGWVRHYFGCLGVLGGDRALFWVDGGKWGIILGGWGWVGHYSW